MEDIMNVSSLLHGKLQRRVGHTLMSVRDVVECEELQQFTEKICLSEKSMVSKDFIGIGHDNKGEENEDDFFIHPQKIIDKIDRDFAVVLTCMDHSTCMFYNEKFGGLCYFDPGPATVISEMTPSESLSVLKDLSHFTQCDVNFIRLTLKT